MENTLSQVGVMLFSFLNKHKQLGDPYGVSPALTSR